MGTRAVQVTFTFSVKGSRNVTDRAWEEFQEAVDKFVDDVDANTVFGVPVVQETTYNREVEVRETLSYDK